MFALAISIKSVLQLSRDTLYKTTNLLQGTPKNAVPVELKEKISIDSNSAPIEPKVVLEPNSAANERRTNTSRVRRARRIYHTFIKHEDIKLFNIIFKITL